MHPRQVEYLKKQIANHIALFFQPRAADLFESGMVRFLPLGQAVKLREKAIAIPFDIPVSDNQGEPYSVELNRTRLTFSNPLPMPSGGGWNPLPNESTPLWYANDAGTLIPAWNLFGTLFHLLTFGEERGSTQRDGHGRFAASFSPRVKGDLLEVPAFNEAVAAIVAACAGLAENGRPAYDLDGLVKPPVMVLSHDCDELKGNDRWTQMVRVARIILPLFKFKLPGLDNLWWIIRNAFTPRRFYFDNATGMLDLERSFGYTSTYYLLNGSGGRFGARSKLAVSAELAGIIPPGWDLGIHYNYDTFSNDQRFEAQLDQLQAAIGSKPVVGRAHYLKFDPAKSFAFWRRFGIYVDESSGYADRIGYRNGIAGCFQVYDPDSNQPLDIRELPMTIMDTTLVRQYGEGAIAKFSQLLFHLSRVGGAMSVVFHPGQFFNPEHKAMLGVYHKMLIECRRQGAVSETARSLVDRVR